MALNIVWETLLIYRTKERCCLLMQTGSDTISDLSGRGGEVSMCRDG